jgi:hypothetical protein
MEPMLTRHFPEPIPEEDAYDDDGYDVDIIDFFKSFRELAIQSLARSDFDKADMILRKAIERSSQSLSSAAAAAPINRETQVSLYLQLAATYCMLGRWGEAAQILAWIVFGSRRPARGGRASGRSPTDGTSR